MIDRAYVSSIFVYYDVALASGYLEELELRGAFSRLFERDDCRDFWREARVVYVEGRSADSRRFAAIADEYFFLADETAWLDSLVVDDRRPAAHVEPVRQLDSTPDRRADSRLAASLLCLQLLSRLVWCSAGFAVNVRHSSGGRRNASMPRR